MVMITLKNDSTLDPLGLYWLPDSRLPLIASTRDIKEESDEYDGEVDFGTELSGFEGQLRCVTDEGLSKEEIAEKKTKLAKLLNLLRTGDFLMVESDPDKKIFVRLSGRVEVQDAVSWFRVNIPIRWDPLWVSVEEKEHTGDGTLENEGTLETPLIMEVSGTVTDPEIVVGEDILAYEGTVGETDMLFINTDKKTVTFNGVNALASFTGTFPKIPPGETVVSVPLDGTTRFRWRDSWL